ncbi:MAG: class I SAM-dependent methyltransferase [Planctomycetota bacterium]|nr:class I SAM-dependent methyltransferase [Planctomycetota bacterium]
MSDRDPIAKAVHIGGGNYFDDMRIDIAESHRRLAGLARNPKSVRKPRWRNLAKLCLAGLSMRLGIREFLVTNGIARKWMDDFCDYWSNVLDGRPIATAIEFFMLMHDYRKRQQYVRRLEWGSPSRHLENWQDPVQIFATFRSVMDMALRPIRCMDLWRRMPGSARVLEYGCSLAPYYYCYREFFSHLDCRWVLADIPGFPFHYARYLYRNDAEVEFVAIGAGDFADPLRGAGNFDIIILTSVLEHLDDPIFVSEYLLKKLKRGGLLVFDYIKSEGKGLDHPASLQMRRKCLENILAKTRLVSGEVGDLDGSVGLCIARKEGE